MFLVWYGKCFMLVVLVNIKILQKDSCSSANKFAVVEIYTRCGLFL